MAIDRFFIAPYDSNSGQQDNIRSWLIPDEAFEELTNAYVFRGRVRKRFGTQWLGNTQSLTRLRVKIGTTNGAGTINTFVPLLGGVPIVTPAIGQMFSINDQIFTVDVLGNPAVLLISGTAVLATFDTTTGQLIINGAAAAADVFYYPALPVMGLLTYETGDINSEITVAFDTRFSYQYANGWLRLNGEITPGASVWAGDNTEFFWATTWTGILASDKVFFVTNFNENEPMRTFFMNNWDFFRPQLTAAPTYLNSALILVVFKNRLVAFNTWEGAVAPGLNYQNRVRWSTATGSPLDVNAWRDDIPGLGNFTDAPTSESITTVEFVKDRLIVFFERSTWELVFTGNQVTPFVWQQINTELGAESTFSIVPFDKVAIGVGNVGIMACNGANVERIDNKIPDSVFEIHNLDGGVERVYGIREFFLELIYWTFPNAEADSTRPYPDRILVYNYKTGTWAFFEDSITVFGYFQRVTGVTWSDSTVTWDDPISWSGASTGARFRQVIAGNQEGWTFFCNPDASKNQASLQITNIAVVNNVLTITAIDHNLDEDQFVYITDVVGTGNLEEINNIIYRITSIVDANNFKILFEDDDGTIIAGTYQGAGVITRVPNINILTKQYNFYIDQGRNAYISKVDFMVDRTAIGELSVDYFVSTSHTPITQEAIGNNVAMGQNILETAPYATVPFENDADRVIHSVYFQADGEFIQLEMYMSDKQMTTVIAEDNGDGSFTYDAIAFQDIQLHSMIIFAQPTSYRNQ